MTRRGGATKVAFLEIEGDRLGPWIVDAEIRRAFDKLGEDDGAGDGIWGTLWGYSWSWATDIDWGPGIVVETLVDESYPV